MSTFRPLFMLGLTLTGACVVPPDDDPTAEIDQAIIGGTLASQFQRDRAVKIPGCTATRISPRWAITALHCNPQVNASVNFYTTGSGVSALTATIDLVRQRPGTSVTACGGSWPWNCDDSTGLFADVALIRLTNIASAIDGTASTPATLAWAFPGDNVAGVQVGAGNHDGVANPSGELRQISDTTDDSEDNSGDFWTTTDSIDPGDSGGPFYVSNRILGTLNGKRWDPIAGQYDLYTSIPKHLDWILSTIGYETLGAPSQQDTVYVGTAIQSFTGSELACQYACDHTQACQAYNFQATSCGLYTNVTSARTQAGWRGALHYGASSGQSNEVVGYRRDDGWNAVLHKATDNTIHEFVISASQWFVGTILPMVGKPIAGKLSPYRRSDGKNAIVYRSSDGSIIEIRGEGSWVPKWINSRAPTATGDPAAFIRADGVSAVVYRAGTRIIELRLLSDGNFASTDLSAQTGTITSFPAASDPMPTVRADGITSVMYRSGSNVVELFRRPGETWRAGVPTQLATSFTAGFPTTVPAATGRPYVSTRRDGTLAILYRSDFNRLVEVRLQSDGWKWQDITGSQTVSGNPVQYVRTDTIESAVYRGPSNQINEQARFAGEPAATLHPFNLSTSLGVGAVTTDPQVYLRNDRGNATVYGLPLNWVGEMQFERGVGWSTNILTLDTGETP